MLGGILASQRDPLAKCQDLELYVVTRQRGIKFADEMKFYSSGELKRKGLSWTFLVSPKSSLES